MGPFWKVANKTSNKRSAMTATLNSSVSAFAAKHRLKLPKPYEDWRLVRKPVIGQINGLDRFRGKAIITNGILVVLENELGHCFIGHLAWFVKDSNEAESRSTNNKVKKKYEVVFSEF